MQIVPMLIFLAVWLSIFWLGSVLLEATGMSRPKARFQALSAMSGTGFTTREAESVVNHPQRRRIVAWLIFIGNAGIVAFIIFMIVYIRAGLEAPSRLHLGIILAGVLLLVLVVRFVDRPTAAIVRLLSRRRAERPLVTEELLYQAGEYGVARLSVNVKSQGLTLQETGMIDRGVKVLAIERVDRVLPFPGPEEPVLAGDCLLRDGRVMEMTDKALRAR